MTTLAALPRLLLACLSILALSVLAAGPASAQELLHELASPDDAGGRFGFAVAGAPDVNGDGRGDLLVGALFAEGAAFQSGRAYVFDGSSGTALYPLDSTHPDPGDIFNDRTGYFGASVAGVPDVDGDGRGDLLVGAPGEDEGSTTDVGRVYLFSGATGGLLYALTSPNAEQGGAFGAAVAGVPDVDGDGRGDLLVGAAAEDPGGLSAAGRIYLFSGATGVLLQSIISPNPEESARFGGSVAGVPDTDGDGRGDLLIGANDEDGGASDAGRAYLFSGMSGTLLHTMTSPAATADGAFGISVAGVPDADGDGRGDLLVGARGEDEGAFGGSGHAYVFSGASGGLLYALTSPNAESGGAFGASVAGVPDVDGDGRGDLLAGASGEYGGADGSGRAYLFSGATGVLLQSIISPNPEESARFGESVASVPDADGDGRGDLLVGASEEDVEPLELGRAYLFAGAPPPGPGCIAFDGIAPGSTFDVGDAVPVDGYAATVQPFTLLSGAPFSGELLVDDFLPGRDGLEASPANALLVVPFAPALSTLTFYYNDLGGSVNLFVNGDLGNVDDFIQLDGTTLGGATVTVTGTAEVGVVTLDGPLNVVGIGGQELFLGGVCPDPGDDTPPVCSLDALNPGPPTNIDVLLSDAESGVASIEIVSATNATVEIPKGSGNLFNSGDVVSLAPPETSPFLVNAVRIDGSLASAISLTVENSAGLGTTCTYDIPEPDTTPPECGPLSFVPVGATYDVVTSATDDVGIASVTFTTLTPNLDGYVDDGGTAFGPFAQGATYLTSDPDPASVGLRGRFTTLSAASFFVTVADAAGNTAVCDPVLTDLAGALPEATALLPSYPNPASGSAAVSVPFTLAEAAEVRVAVYDVLGREVAVLADEVMEPGRYEVSWPEARSLPSGSYVVRLAAGAHVQTQRLTLVR